MAKKTLSLLFLISFCSIYSQVNWENHMVIDNLGKQQPRFVTSGDINGDGFSDIIVGADNGLCWFKNLGNQGNFSRSINIDATSDPHDITIADFDGDGFNDIVYTRSNGNLKELVWAKNADGLGAFATPTVLATNFYTSTRIQVIDMNADGALDIVYNNGNNSLLILKNNGSGTFTSQSAGMVVDTFFAIDVNGDQLVDIIYKTGYLLKYMQQNSDGTFLFKENMDSFIVNNYGNSFISGGDIDNDGDIDIAVIHENGSDRRIKWYKNTDNVFANFLTLTLLPSTSGASNYDNRSMILKDLNNDGLIDVVMHHSFLNKISWYKNLGTTGFAAEQTITSTLVDVRSIAIADFNNDSKLDIVGVGATNNDIVWYNNVNGTGTTFTSNQISEFVLFPSKVSIGDLDGNGTKDVLVTSTNDNKLSWYSNLNGNGNFSEKQKIITNTLLNVQNGLISDLNGDGKNDVVALSNSYEEADQKKIVQYISTGNGNFTTAQTIYSSLVYILKMETIDVDNDGDFDLVCSFDSGDIKIFKNNGNATYATPVSFPNSAGFFVPTDVDNDGDLDLIVSTTTSFFWLENTDGQGNFSVKHPITTNLALPKNFVIGAQNSDGSKEIIYANSKLGKIIISPTGTFGSQSTFSDLGNSYLLDMADLDNDGDLDIVCSTAVNNHHPGYSLARFRWYENLGNETFSLPMEIYFENINDIPYHNGYTSLALDDLDGDGKKDIVLSIAYHTKVMWFKNLGTFANKIQGKVKLDVANDSCVSNGPVAQQILVTTSSSDTNLSTFTAPDGGYSFKVNEGNYTTKVSTPVPFYPASPNSVISDLVGLDNVINANFCLQPTQSFNDSQVSFYPITTARPGFVAQYVMVVKNKGTNTINSSVAINYNPSKLQFLSADAEVSSQTGSILNFAISNLQPFQQLEVVLNFQVHQIPNVSLGEIIQFSINNDLTSDVTPADNTFVLNQTIVGSYDPNDITVLEGSEVLMSQSENYLHYIIRFQNTGNYYAERVVITAPIDSKLDWRTMELESFSHPQHTEISNGNQITFTFDAIYLPGQSQNEDGSNGYVAFKIKPQTTVSLGDIIEKQASIYFDYNPAIITNQVETEFVNFLEISDFETQKIVAYPNPVKDFLHISPSESKYQIEVYNMLGQVVKSDFSTNAIDFTNLATGVYLVKILSETKKTQIIRVLKN